MEVEVDRISNLPELLVDDILSLLTIRDAVRTSILSSKWRYKWMNLKSLVFDDHSVPVSNQDPTMKTIKMVVDHLLFFLNGPIHKFKLSHNKLVFSSCDIDRWILFLSRPRASVKEFILDIWKGQRYKLPSSLYLCDKLSHLELYNCLLNPPLTFNGFKILTSLDLRCITIGQDVFENLIYRCPLLQWLILKYLKGCSQLKINAPKLTFVEIEGDFQDVIFENTFHLSDVSVALVVNDDNIPKSTSRTTSKLIKFFSSLPSIQRLKMSRLFLKLWAVDQVPWRLLTPCMELNYLSLDIDFSNMVECLAFLCILRNSPNLLELDITLTGGFALRKAAANNLLDEDHGDCTFNQLRFVKFDGIIGVSRELGFIKLLLVISPVLERMTIKSASENTGLVLFKELLRFKRASENAEIIYLE